jgi:hypothetical protein
MIMPFDNKRLDDAMGHASPPVDLEKMNRLLAMVSHAHNTKPDPEMGGLSPEQVMRLSYTPWGQEGGPIQFNVGLSLADAERSPFFRRARKFLCAVRDAGGVKATSGRNLNRSFVAAMMNALLSDEEREDTTSYFKAPNEQDVFPLHVVRVVAEIAGLIRLVKGQFTVPKTKGSLLAPERAGELFRDLFHDYFVKFNLAYLTRYTPEAGAIQSFAGYTLFRLGVIAGDGHPVKDLANQVLLPAVRREVEAEIINPMFVNTGHLLESRILKPLIEWGLLEGRYEHSESRHFQTLVSIRVTALYRDFLRFQV